MRLPAHALALLAALLTAGCGDGGSAAHTSTPRDAGGPARDARPDPNAWSLPPLNRTPEVDLLFVVDNSPGMLEEQGLLARALPEFLQEIQRSSGAPPDVRIAFLSSDLGAAMYIDRACRYPGDGGRFLVSGDLGQPCGLQEGHEWIHLAPGLQPQNLTDGKSVPEVLGCLAQRGQKGCGYEQHLNALSRAVATDRARPPGQRFLRDDSVLGLIVLADEDDCSALGGRETDFYNEMAAMSFSYRCSAWGHYCDDGKSIEKREISMPLARCGHLPTFSLPPFEPIVRGGPLLDVWTSMREIDLYKYGRVVASAIVGWPLPGTEESATYRVTRNRYDELELAPICTSSHGPAAPALRLKGFVESFHGGRVYSICEEDYTGHLTAIARAIGAKAKAIFVGP
jgi:hypothetical protein